jgi:tRNA/rRNA methyltransferase
MLERALVVLVRPHYPGNIGSTARVMHNLGLSRLVLVEPQTDPLSAEARRLSTHGEPILHAARVVPDLGEAVAECALVVGTSAIVAGLFREQTVRTPRLLMPTVVATLAQSAVGLVFGPEPVGLTNAELSRCHYLLHIPTDPQYPALNLAQAVAITLYELRLAWLDATRADQGGLPAGIGPEPPATFAELERMYQQLRQALEAIHFLYGNKADTLWHAMRHLLGRAQPSAAEVRRLLGLARQIRWVARQLPGGPAPPPALEEPPDGDFPVGRSPGPC